MEAKPPLEFEDLLGAAHPLGEVERNRRRGQQGPVEIESDDREPPGHERILPGAHVRSEATPPKAHREADDRRFTQRLPTLTGYRTCTRLPPVCREKLGHARMVHKGPAAGCLLKLSAMPLDWQVLPPFLLAVLVIQVTPGPGMLFILANGIAGGPRSGVAAAFGAATGMLVHTAAAAAGLAAVFRAAPPIYDGVRLLGATYLLWLAVAHLRSPGVPGSIESATSDGSTRRVYLRSMLNNLANPKVILFFVAFLPQFVIGGAGPAAVQFASLGVIFLLVGLVLDVGIGVLAGRVGQCLRRRNWMTTMLDRLAGAIFAVLGVRLALDVVRR